MYSKSQEIRESSCKDSTLQATLQPSLSLQASGTRKPSSLRPMLLLALLLFSQMPAMVGSRSILGSLQRRNEMESEEAIITDSLKEDMQRSLTASEERVKRGIHDAVFWPNATIPFVFHEPFARRYKKRVVKAMSMWEEETCIKFVDRTDEEYFATFEINTYTCDSAVGLLEYPMFQQVGQPVKFTETCLKRFGSILHELGHLIGFYHEHQRPDRDEYIHVNYSNVQNMFHSQFDKKDFETYGPYDLESVMHYPLNAFAKAGKESMEVLPNVTVPEDVDIGLVKEVSPLDAERASLMYQCSNGTMETSNVTTDDRSGDNIYAGEQVGLQVKWMANDVESSSDNSWLSCTQQQCTVNSCPGARLNAQDTASCPFNIFTLHKLSAGLKSEPSSAVVRVGDIIVLEHRLLDGTEEGEGQHKSLFVSCQPDTQVCSLSLQCTANISDYNTTSQCRDNMLVVRAEGKQEGTPITHQDIIGFEYITDNGHNAFFNQQCAFGCDPVTKVCSKELCIHTNFNTLGEDLSSSETPKCGKDMFLIQKL